MRFDKKPFKHCSHMQTFWLVIRRVIFRVWQKSVKEKPREKPSKSNKKENKTTNFLACLRFQNYVTTISRNKKICETFILLLFLMNCGRFAIAWIFFPLMLLSLMREEFFSSSSLSEVIRHHQHNIRCHFPESLWEIFHHYLKTRCRAKRFKIFFFLTN